MGKIHLQLYILHWTDFLMIQLTTLCGEYIDRRKLTDLKNEHLNIYFLQNFIKQIVVTDESNSEATEQEKKHCYKQLTSCT